MKLCPICDGYYNGAEHSSYLAHRKICKPSKEYKRKMKEVVKELLANKEFMAGIKEFSKKIKKAKKK